jgi:hypothetical protein
MGYKVLVDELTVHRTVSSLPQPDGSTVHQNGMGQTYYRDDVIPDDAVGKDIVDALESGDGPLAESLKDKLEKSSDAGGVSARASGVPFVGYDDMDEDEVLAAMKALPSAAQQRIKEYEATRDEPRERIANYNIGFGESPMDRVEGKVSGDLQEGAEDKAASRIATREVTDDSVTPGEGITGSGDPQAAYGSKEDKEKGDVKGTGLKTRRGRRDRQPKPPEGPGTTSLERANE